MTATDSRRLRDHSGHDGAANDRAAVTVFVAPWCGACRRLAPVLEEVAARHQPAVRLVTVSVDEDPARAAEHGVRATPTIIVAREGREVARVVGAVREAELDRLFGAAGSDEVAPDGAGRAGGRADVTLRLGAGASLLTAGLVAGGQPVLLLGGAAVVAWAVAAWAVAPLRLRRRTGAASPVPDSTR